MKKMATKANEITKTTRLDTGSVDIASKIAAVVTGAVAKKSKLSGASSSNGSTTVNIHVGDIYLIGFDEAIDAEEWGMRETNTEITGGASRPRKSTSPVNEDALVDKNRVIARRIDFSKGGVKLIATESSKPAAKKARITAANKQAAKKRVRRRK